MSVNHTVEKMYHPVQDLFSYDAPNNKSNCLNCDGHIKGKHSSNLLRHLKHRHSSIYQRILPQVAKFHISKNRSNHVNVQVNLDIVKKALVSLVTIDGRPYSCLEDNGMKLIMGMIYKECQKAGIQYCINRSNIADHVSQVENRMVSQIANEMQNKLFSVQMDIASTQERYNMIDS